MVYILKIGIFKNIESGVEYIVVKNSVVGKGERIELYHRAEDYTPVDTYNAVGAYYRKSREYVNGDDSIIREYLSVFTACINARGEIKQTTAITPQGFMLCQEKVNSSLDISSKSKSLKGIIVEEEYKAKGWIISIDSIEEEDTTMFIDPLNLRDYTMVSIFTDFTDDDTLDADYYNIDNLKSRYNLDHIDNYDYVVVEDYETAVQRLQIWKDAKVKLKSVDIESTGLDVSVFGKDLITGVVLSYDWVPLGEVENSTYFPFRQKNFEYNLPIEFLKEIQEAINSQPKYESLDLSKNDGVIILAHNGKMEYKSFWQDSLDIRIDIDTHVLSQLIDTHMQRGLHTLKNRAKNATNLFWLELEQVFKNKLIRFDILPSEIVKYYACPDTPNTIKVYKHLMSKLPVTEHFVLQVDSDLQICKAINEYYGLRIDQEGLIRRLKNVEFICDKLSSLFKQIHKTSKNINSADVLRDIVYMQLGCKVVVRTKKKKPSTSADAIKNIVDNNIIKDVDLDNKYPSDIIDLYGESIVEGSKLKSNRYPSLVILSYYNKFKKELSALRRLQKKSNLNRVMFGINGKGAASGRQSSDAHQYSSTMKDLVLADTPEHYLVDADYAQVELRILAYIIQDLRLIEQMKDKHIDIHRAFLSVINGTPVHMISAEMRSNGKRVNFGVVYGISEFGLARDIYGPGYTKEQRLECKKSITDFFNGIPGCKDLADANREFVFKNGYIENKFGYRRLFPQVFSDDLTDEAKASIFRQANNSPVQGFGAYLMKLAEINFDNYIREKGWDKTITYMDKEFPMVRVMLSIHDEVLLSVHHSIPKEDITLMCKECMEIEVKDAPPFFAVPAFVDNWGQAKSSKYEMSISMRDDILEAWKEGKSIVDWTNSVKAIEDYKFNQIKTYMTSLIEKYSTEELIIKNVTHPEFTHLLISIYLTDKEIKSNSHTECIALAVKAYMSNSDAVVSFSNIAEKEYIEDANIQDSLSYLKEFEEYIEIDANGESIILDNVDSDLQDIDNVDSYADQVAEDEHYAETHVDAVYLGNIVIIDTTDIQEKDVLRNFYNELLELCSDDGYYQVNFMRGSSMLPTKLKMHPNLKAVQEIIEKYRL